MYNNWQAAQGQIADAPQGGGGGGGGVEIPAEMDAGDWRDRLQLDTRILIINKIMDYLIKCLPFSGQEGLQGFKEIAVEFEEKMYSVATSKSDYLKKIAAELISMVAMLQKQSNGANTGQSSL